MPIDPTGTAPGVTLTPMEPEPINMRCRRDGCDSILAVEIKIPNLESRRMYKCTKCHHTHGVPTGGSFNYF